MVFLFWPLCSRLLALSQELNQGGAAGCVGNRMGGYPLLQHGEERMLNSVMAKRDDRTKASVVHLNREG